MGYDAVVQLLITRGDIDINIKDSNGWTALFAAVRGYKAVVRLLVERYGVDINAKDVY